MRWSARHWIAAGIALCYAVAVFLIAFSPDPVDSNDRGLTGDIIGWLQVNGVPWMRYAFLEAAANVIFFIPFGILVTLLIGWKRWWLAALVGVAASAAIEAAQILLPGRNASPRDILTNSIGALIGSLLVVAFNAVRERMRRSRAVAQEPADRPTSEAASADAAPGSPG